MQIKFSTKHGSLHEADEQYMTGHVQRLLHIFDRIEQIEVVVSWERNDHHKVSEVEILVNCEHKHDFVAKHIGDGMSLQPTFDLAMSKMESQIRKYKDRVTNHHK